MPKLLTRQEFKERVLGRSLGRCVFCGNAAVDAHHIIERRLWPNGGYYEDNGIAVCEPCHLKCESTQYSVEEARFHGNITQTLVPPSFYKDYIIDKWGNEIIPNTNYSVRYPGPLSDDPSVRKILGTCPHVIAFERYRKYPRTPHLPNSPGMADDDFTWNFKFGNTVVVTEKMDGECTTMYNDYVHARSIDGPSHGNNSRRYGFWAERCSDIPPHFRICGEWLSAKHSIHYDDLESYFLGFSVWEKGVCLSWNETLEWFELLNIQPVPTISIFPNRGSTDDLAEQAQRLWTLYCIKEDDQRRPKVSASEGFVIRSANSFTAQTFNVNVGKWVRPNHVATDRHWRNQPVIENNLRHSK